MSKSIGDCLSGRQNNFDFVRFVAALIVIFSHSFDLTASNFEEPLEAFTDGRFDTAHLSVAAFFIISGFLITMSYERSHTIYEYFESRILRIYPALFVVILCSVFILGPLVTTYNIKDYFFNSQTIKYFFANILAVRIQYILPGVFEDNFKPNTVNASLWTLPIEIACYVAVAVVGEFFARRIKVALVLLAVLSACFYYIFLSSFIGLVFYFLCGALIYIYRNKIVLNKWLFLVFLLILLVDLRYSVFFNTNSLLKAFAFFSKAVVFSYIIMYISFIKTGSLSRFSKNGDFSYGLYIWAFPVQQLLIYQYKEINPYLFFVVSALITLLLSVLSWKLVEKRALKYKKKLIRRNAEVILT